MKIYNYLFYKCYQLSLRSRNFDDFPVLGGVTVIALCVMFNVFSLFFVLEGFGLMKSLTINRSAGFLFSLIIIVLLLVYYQYNERYTKITMEMERMEKRIGVALHPLIVIVIYYGISTFILFIAALFSNGDWIFKK